MRTFGIISPVTAACVPAPSGLSQQRGREAGTLLEDRVAASRLSAPGPASPHTWRGPFSALTRPRRPARLRAAVSHGAPFSAHHSLSLTPSGFPARPPHSPASRLPLLSCLFMREITRRPACQQLPCKSYLQKGGEGEERGGKAMRLGLWLP